MKWIYLLCHMSIFNQESVIRLKGTMMKTAKRRSILPTLFIPYTVLFILLFTVIISYFVVSESKNIHESSLRSIENSLINISNKEPNIPWPIPPTHMGL